MTQAVFRLPLIDQYLEEQQRLTVVERFAQRHDAEELPANAASYEALIPLSKPKPGEQYAFAVDLDACTGCKACVAACHRLNGLDEDELWRSVGLLHGGNARQPMVQTVTTACHHCVEPACMKGCPVAAYEKDPETGIVRHLDDQCIGCQYCVFTCPYEVPRFNMNRGIVRKCDMCGDRLAAGEAPACVQACPSGAISIRIVAQSDLRKAAAAGEFLPGAPSPTLTTPSTRYESKRPLPAGVVSADTHRARPAHEHVPLVVMLVLTQLSVGAYVTELVLTRLGSHDHAVFRPYHALVALVLGLVALGASTLHLGRPRYAFRAFIGLRTSWMSREILAFGAYAGLATAYAGALWAGAVPAVAGRLPHGIMPRLQEGLGLGVALAGLFSVFCSMMIYHVTHRRWWSAPRTAFRFFGTAILLGLATTLATSMVASGAFASAHAGLSATRRLLVFGVMGTALLKMGGELLVLRHRRRSDAPDLQRTAILLTGQLGDVLRRRLLAGALGGMVLPGLLLLSGSEVATASTAGTVISLLMLLVLTAAEMLERRLFFSAVSPPRMPGKVGG
jgi:formate dehydrogenase iron-sulfur subunit